MTGVHFVQTELEAVGPAFVKEKMLETRAKTRAAISTIAARCMPGMVEEDAVAMARDVLAGEGMVRGWHDVYVRFGRNTLKTFGADSEPGVVLGTNDIFFIDVGPVFGKFEGDGGDTFVTGSRPDLAQCATDAQKIFHIVRKEWENTKMSGKALYGFAAEQARLLGWELNMDLSGHRLSDFPHAAIYDGPLADVDFSPSPLLWVLEIHIRHPQQLYGAFFEDMLLDDTHFS